MSVDVRAIVVTNHDNGLSYHVIRLETGHSRELIRLEWLLNHVFIKVLKLNQFRQNILESVER